MVPFLIQWIGMGTIGTDIHSLSPQFTSADMVAEQDRMLKEGNPSPEAVFGPPEAENDSQNSCLRTSVRRTINPIIAHLLPAKITPAIPPPETRL